MQYSVFGIRYSEILYSEYYSDDIRMGSTNFDITVMMMEKKKYWVRLISDAFHYF